jgi:Mg-chelatase subunit ChlD
MSPRQVPRASGLADRGPSLVARVGVVVVTVLVVTSTVAAAGAVAAPADSGGASDGSTGLALDTTVPDSAATTDRTPSLTKPSTVDTSTDAATQPIDVVFVVDSSESMNRERYELAGEMREFQRTLVRKNVNARFGLVTYTDDARVRQGMTDDFSKVEDAMQFEPQGNVERASDALLAADGMNFRSNAKKVFVLMTDEDDDSALETRQEALSTVSEHVFVAVSPSDVGASGCDLHYEPCDNSSTNELKRYAGQVRGEWIDIDTEAADTMRQVSTVVADAAGVESSVSERDGSRRVDFEVGPDISVSDTSTNQTRVEVGEAFAVNATFRNDGLSDGSVEAYAATNGRVLQNETVTVEHLSDRSVSLVHAFEEPGVYSIVLNNERVGDVLVTDLAETNVSVDTSPARNRVLASVAEATAGEPVDIALPSSSLLSMQGTDLTGVRVVTESGIVRPAHDLGFEMAVERKTTPPADTGELSADATGVTYLSVTSTLANDDISAVSFQFANRTTDVTMYRYDRAAEEWTALSQTELPEKNQSLVANTTELSWFAVAVEGPIVSVESVSTGSTDLSQGDLLSSTITVRNHRDSERSYEATVSLDGEVVHTKTVTVSAGETVDVDIAYEPASPGEYDLSVAGTDQGALVVASESGTDRSETSSGEDESTTTSSDDTTTTRSEASTTQSDASTPGLGPIATILALVLGATLVLVRRRRDE